MSLGEIAPKMVGSNSKTNIKIISNPKTDVPTNLQVGQQTLAIGDIFQNKSLLSNYNVLIGNNINFGVNATTCTNNIVISANELRTYSAHFTYANSSFNTLIGTGTRNTGNSYTTAIGYACTVGGNGNSGIAIGNTASCSGGNSIAIGTNTSSSGSSSISIGNNATCQGQNFGIAIGASCTAQNAAQAVAIGYASYAHGLNSISMGYNNANMYQYSIALGSNITIEYYGEFALSSGYFTTPGTNSIKSSQVQLCTTLTNTSSTILGVPNGSVTTTTNKITLANNSAYLFDVDLVVSQTGSVTTLSGMYNVKFGMTRGAAAANTTLMGTPIQTTIYDLTGFTIAVTADTTNGCPQIAVTYANYVSTARVVATVKITKMTP